MDEYDENGVLIRVKTSSDAISAGEGADIIAESIVLSGNGYVKLFLLDSETKPLHMAVKID